MAQPSTTWLQSSPASPRVVTALADDVGSHAWQAVDVGAGLLGLQVHPQQLELAALLCAHTAQVPGGAYVPALTEVAVQLPRRSGKTTTILATAVGRCVATPGYSATYCAQSGTKSRERFYGTLKALRLHSRGLGGWRARESRGEERLEFGNGSMLRFMPPLPASFRGDDSDLIVLDEAQEVDDDARAAVLGAALPLLDTRPAGQLVVAGTAGAHRTGLLWHALTEGRAGRWGILEYGADESTDDLDDPDTWARVHPGIGTLTTAATIARRHAQLDPAEFAREYLGVWPATVAETGFSAELWDAAGGTMLTLPDRFGLAFEAELDGSGAAVVAAWRVRGRAHLLVLDARPGTSWVDSVVLPLSRRHRVPIGYDAHGAALDVADRLARARPAPTLQGLRLTEYVAACAALAADVVDSNLRHARQPDLDGAVTSAARRRIGDAGWGWGRRASSGPIAALVAATVALRVYDELPARTGKPTMRHAS